MNTKNSKVNSKRVLSTRNVSDIPASKLASMSHKDASKAIKHASVSRLHEKNCYSLASQCSQASS